MKIKQSWLSCNNKTWITKNSFITDIIPRKNHDTSHVHERKTENWKVHINCDFSIDDDDTRWSSDVVLLEISGTDIMKSIFIILLILCIRIKRAHHHVRVVTNDIVKCAVMRSQSIPWLLFTCRQDRSPCAEIFADFFFFFPNPASMPACECSRKSTHPGKKKRTWMEARFLPDFNIEIS